MDKPKTPHEQLVELAEWIRSQGYAVRRHNYHLGRVYFSKAAEVHAMAERVKGKLIASVYYLTTDGRPGFVACTDAGNYEAWGMTKEEALANLQAAEDEED